MRKTFFLILLSCFLPVLIIQAQTKSKKKSKSEPVEKAFQLKTLMDTISYIVGTDVAFTLKSNGMELNAEAFNQGFSQAWSGNDTIFTTAQAETIMVKYGSELQAKRQKEKAEKDSAVISEGKAFLEENKTKEGVITTESGLQYTVLKMGDGEKPTAENQVKVHYKGMLLDGTVFDSSYERGEPNTFDLARLIPGWTEGIQLMPVGSIFKFYIPSELGYGAQEIGAIPPNSTLIFEVELVGIE
jgi:FKBP-type peptidyl-prolyl cis-trans isomerase